VTEAEQHFGIRITEEEAGDVTSLDGLAGLIRKKQLENRECSGTKSGCSSKDRSGRSCLAEHPLLFSSDQSIDRSEIHG
jgi:hypothetical protein